MEKSAKVVLANKRFVEDDNERILLEKLKGCGVSNPQVPEIGFGAMLPGGYDSTSYYADLRDIINGASEYESRRGERNRKAIEERFREAPTSSLALAIM